mmetsp:Transcript_28490/g.92347  ORF Transcript_28490/g.92347 Transcript_28490/m.92347 type:complete len:221 (-) Transcript_28490:431-1093(-)
MKTAMHADSAHVLISRPSLCSFCCSGVRLGPLRFFFWPPAPAAPSPPLLWLSSAAMRPTRVSIPVSTTTATACPCAQVVEEKAMFIGVSLPSSLTPPAVAFLDTSTGSPVSSISFTLKPVAEISRTSAGTTLPVSSSSTSPRTSCALGTSRRSPSRITTHEASPMRASASSALLAERSLYVATVALSKMMMMTATPSTHSPSASDATQAAKSSTMIRDAN